MERHARDEALVLFTVHEEVHAAWREGFSCTLPRSGHFDFDALTSLRVAVGVLASRARSRNGLPHSLPGGLNHARAARTRACSTFQSNDAPELRPTNVVTTAGAHDRVRKRDIECASRSSCVGSRRIALFGRMQNIRLVYVSEQRPHLEYADLTSILETAVDQNKAKDITGVLVHGSGAFMQALEGERSVVSSLYTTIVRDSRHTRCELLQVEEITTRIFPDWSMKLLGVDGAQRRELLQQLQIDHFEPRRMTSAQAYDFLQRLAASERESTG